MVLPSLRASGTKGEKNSYLSPDTKRLSRKNYLHDWLVAGGQWAYCWAEGAAAAEEGGADAAGAPPPHHPGPRGRAQGQVQALGTGHQNQGRGRKHNSEEKIMFKRFKVVSLKGQFNKIKI